MKLQIITSTLCTDNMSGNVAETPRLTCSISENVSQPAEGSSSISLPAISLYASPVFFKAVINCLVVKLIGLPLLVSPVDDDHNPNVIKIKHINDG